MSNTNPGGGVLVVQPLPGIGDMAWHLPHIHAIARSEPEQRVAVLTKPRSHADELFTADPWVESVLWIDSHRGKGAHDGLTGTFRLARMIRQQRFRTAWILHESPRYTLACRLAGIPLIRSYHNRLHSLLGNRSQGLGRAERGLHPVDKASAFLRQQGIQADSDPPFLLLDADASEMLARRHTDHPRPWIVIGVGSSEPAKQWGADRFAKLARRLKQHSVSLFLVGGAAEQELLETIRQQLDDQPEVRFLVGRPLTEVANILGLSDLYVGNDTGILNLAAALGIRCIGLFGASPPLTHLSNIEAITPLQGFSGMESIEVARVEEKIIGSHHR